MLECFEGLGWLVKQGTNKGILGRVEKGGSRRKRNEGVQAEARDEMRWSSIWSSVHRRDAGTSELAFR